MKTPIPKKKYTKDERLFYTYVFKDLADIVMVDDRIPKKLRKSFDAVLDYLGDVKYKRIYKMNKPKD